MVWRNRDSSSQFHAKIECHRKQQKPVASKHVALNQVTPFSRNASKKTLLKHIKFTLECWEWGTCYKSKLARYNTIVSLFETPVATIRLVSCPHERFYYLLPSCRDKCRNHKLGHCVSGEFHCGHFRSRATTKSPCDCKIQNSSINSQPCPCKTSQTVRDLRRFVLAWGPFTNMDKRSHTQ